MKEFSKIVGIYFVSFIATLIMVYWFTWSRITSPVLDLDYFYEQDTMQCGIIGLAIGLFASIIIDIIKSKENE